MTVLAAARCASGVLVAADSKRSDMATPDAELPPVRKVQQVRPWCVMAAGGAGTLGDAVRIFVRSICYYRPPSYDEVLQKSIEALQFMYGKYAERYPEEGQPLTACLAGVPPGGKPRIAVLSSAEQFRPTELPETTSFWVAASDPERARQVLESLWEPEVAEDPELARRWVGAGMEQLVREIEGVGLPVYVAFIDRNGKHHWSLYPTQHAWFLNPAH